MKRLVVAAFLLAMVGGCTGPSPSPPTAADPPSVSAQPLRPRAGHTAALLADGRVLIVGGWAREGTAALAEAEMFDPTTGTFQPAGTLRGSATLLRDVLSDAHIIQAGP